MALGITAFEERLATARLEAKAVEKKPVDKRKSNTEWTTSHLQRTRDD